MKKTIKSRVEKAVGVTALRNDVEQTNEKRIRQIFAAEDLIYARLERLEALIQIHDDLLHIRPVVYSGPLCGPKPEEETQ
jgi:hypothetical protein